MLQHIERVERLIVRAVMVFMLIVVVLATIELGWIIAIDVLSPPLFLLEIGELLDLFGLFLLVLIGLELLELIKTYEFERVIHVEVALTVGMIALARKVVIMDVKEVGTETLLGVAAVILALAIAYYALKAAAVKPTA
jgi:uncharacterized membrane protein (DUF373 family)